MNIKKYTASALMITLLFLSVTAMAAPVGKITSLVGNADITHPGGTAQIANVSDPINVGDRIRTKSKAKAEITFNEGNILRLAENTRVDITEYMSGQKKNSSILSLLRGKIQNIVKNIGGSDGRYEVHTPTSVCGVRGTYFFNFYLAGVSGSLFQEGSGYGYNKNTPQNVQTINAGQGMFVSSANLGTQLRNISNNELDAMRNATENTGSSGSSGGSGGVNGEFINQPLTGCSGGACPPPTPQPGFCDTHPSDPACQTDFCNTHPSDPACQQPPPPPPPSSNLSATFDNTGVTFPNLIDSGTLTGTSSDNGATYNLTVTGTVTGTPSDPAGTMVKGTLGSGAAFSGYLMGMPGSWKGLMSTIYVTGTQAGFMIGPLSGTFSGTTFDGTGVAVRYAPIASTTILPANLVLTQWNNFTLPSFGDVFVDSVSVSLLCSSATCSNEVSGIDVTGGKIGVGGSYSVGGMFSNIYNITDFSHQQYFKYDSDTKAALLSTNILGHIDLSTGHNQVSISGDFVYMDPLYKGIISLNSFGIYDETQFINNYKSISGYTIQLQPWTFANELSDSGSMEGILGSTENIWTNPSVAFSSIGRFTDISGQFNILSGPWQSYNYTGSGNALTNNGGGAYTGYLMKQIDILAAGSTVTTDALALYIDTNGNAGILRGNGSGQLYALAVAAFSVDGTLTNTLMDTGIGVDPTTFGYGYGAAGIDSKNSHVQTGQFCPGCTNLIDGGLGPLVDLTPLTTSSNGINITGISTWGIGKGDLNGTYSGDPRGDMAFSYYFNDLPDGSGGALGSEIVLYTQSSANYNSTDGGSSRGSVVGATADWQSATTSVFGGTAALVYDPVTSGTWRGTALTTRIETNRFITMTGTPDGRAALAALNIPFVNVGTVNMSMTASPYWSSLSINNMGFYAYSAGGMPQLFASNSVTGTYYSSPAGSSTPLQGSAGGHTFNANFNVTNWDTDFHKWGATITNGTIAPGLNGATKFNGVAAGTITGSSITGTAAGVAHGGGLAIP